MPLTIIQHISQTMPTHMRAHEHKITTVTTALISAINFLAKLILIS